MRRDIESKAERMTKILAPSAPIHKQENALNQVRKCTLEVKTLIDAILNGPEIHNAISSEMALAVRGFENAGRWPQNKKKPLLNTADL